MGERDVKLAFVALTVLLAVHKGAAQAIFEDCVEVAFELPEPEVINDLGFIGATIPNNGSSVSLLSGMEIVFTGPVDSPLSFAAGPVYVRSPVLLNPGLGFATAVETEDQMVITARFQFFSPQISVELEGVRNGSEAGSFAMNGTACHTFEQPAGVRVVRSAITQQEGVDALTNLLESNPDGPALIANIDHAEIGAAVNISLPPSNLLAFGRPQLGAPLWTQTGSAGIELPTEMLIASSPLGFVYVAYNTVPGLQSRFGLEGVDELLNTINNALNDFASAASGRTLQAPSLNVTVTSPLLQPRAGLSAASDLNVTAAEANARMAASIMGIDAQVAFQIDHAASAAAQDVPTNGLQNAVYCFSISPEAPSRMIQGSFTSALDLPFKIGIWTNAFNRQRVFGGQTTPQWIAERHFIAGMPRVRLELLEAQLQALILIALGLEPPGQ